MFKRFLQHTACVALVLIIFQAPAKAADVEDLYGQWSGTWFVDEWFEGNTGVLIPNAPVEDASFTLSLHAFDGEDYGEITIFSNFDIINFGVVSGLAVTGNDVTIALVYPELGIPTEAGAIFGVFDASTVTGNYDESVIPVSNIVGWKGPMVMTSSVPEVGTFGQIGLGLAALFAMFGRRGFGRRD